MQNRFAPFCADNTKKQLLARPVDGLYITNRIAKAQLKYRTFLLIKQDANHRELFICDNCNIFYNTNDDKRIRQRKHI